MNQVWSNRIRAAKRLDPSQRRNVGMSFTVREGEREEITRIAFESGYPSVCAYLRARALPQEQKQGQELEAVR
jgi:hypothetical protein